ncbi:MAG: hypothetical protein IJ217_06060 [Clostridia bacterium]|nr:hypothetical protein [Clostridia bacterium]
MATLIILLIIFSPTARHIAFELFRGLFKLGVFLVLLLYVVSLFAGYR